MSSEYLTVQEALEKLRVKPASLYSYVSRGLVRRLKQKGQRQSFYSKIDVERLVARRNARRGHKAVAGAALLWGDPILETAISWIDEQGPHYRGHSLESLLASQHPFENVAELLWTGILPTSSVRWPASSRRSYGSASPHERAQRHFLDLLDFADGPTMDQK
ncbi:MAG: citrate synthase, partial [Deltaproteobacteria bacterium]|nr:citrate synthase [Deltaproteobacteria bacterium]